MKGLIIVVNILKGVSAVLQKSLTLSGERKQKINPAPPIPAAEFDQISEPVSELFEAGFAKAPIIPDDVLKRRYYIAGYQGNNPATEVLDVPFVHSFWLDDCSGRGGVLFVSCDVVGLLNKDVLWLRKALEPFAKKNCCRSINILSTHNHAGIDTMGLWGPLPFASGRSPKYMNIIKNAICSTAEEAFNNKRAGRLFLGTIEVPDMQEDIRIPEVYSKTLTRLRFNPADGSRDIYFVNFASHSESLQGSNSRVSADFPCYLRRRIFEKTGAETIYAVGAIGGMISMFLESEEKSILVSSTMQLGKRLADYALSIDNETELRPKINLLRQEFYIEIDNDLLAVAGAAGYIRADRYAVSWASKGYALKSEISYFEIDNLPFLLLPCEIFPELVFGGYLSAEEAAQGTGAETNPIPLNEIVGMENLLVFGLANDEFGYVVPPNDFLLSSETPYLEEAHDKSGRKHYEETNSLGPKTAQTIANVVSEMMKVVKGK